MKKYPRAAIDNIFKIVPGLQSQLDTWYTESGGRFADDRVWDAFDDAKDSLIKIINLKDVFVAIKNSKQVDIAFQSRFLTGDLSRVSVSGGGTFFGNGVGHTTLNHNGVSRIIQTIDTNNLSTFELQIKDGTIVTITIYF